LCGRHFWFGDPPVGILSTAVGAGGTVTHSRRIWCE
jgi:hypothetical protein